MTTSTDTLRHASPPPAARPPSPDASDEPRLRLLALLEELAGRLREQRSDPELRQYLALRRRLR